MTVIRSSVDMGRDKNGSFLARGVGRWDDSSRDGNGRVFEMERTHLWRRKPDTRRDLRPR